MKKNIVFVVLRICFSILTASAVLLLLFVFFSGYLKKNAPVKFGATYMTMNNPYFQILDETMKCLVNDYGDVFISRDPAQNQERQNLQILDMIDEGISVLLLNPVDRIKVLPAIDACLEAGVAVFIVDTDVSDSSNIISVIQSDNYMAGRQCAEDMVHRMSGGADIVVLYDTRISSTRQRFDGFISTVRKHRNFNIVKVITDVSEIEVATEKFGNFLEEGMDFDVVFANNDPTALGSLAALQQRGLDDKILIYGIDGSPDAKSMISKGFITGTAAQYPVKIGKLTVETAYRYLDGKDVPKQILVDTDMIVLWVLANILLYTLNNRRKIVSIIVICAGMFVYLCSDFGLLSIVLDLYSIHDYINFYDDKVNQIYLLGLYDFFQIGTIVCFIVFCTTTLISKQDSLHKINDLYLQLTQAHANLKTANHEIEKYMFEQVKTIEIQERNRLAREIHDTVGHTLAGIVAGLDACNTLMQSNSDKFNQQLKLVTDMAREGVLEIRRSVNHLRPDLLERLSLESAIRRLVNNTESVTGIHVMFSSTVRNFDLDEDEELAVYRIIQESITNAIKHSHADTIDLKIQKSENAIRISIHDNGIGCPDIHFGFGLSHMQSRIEMLHGELKVWTENGFSIEAVIPLRKNLEAEQ